MNKKSQKSTCSTPESTGKVATTKEEVVNQINLLKSTCLKTVFRALTTVRNKIIQTDTGITLLHENGGFKQLVKLLSMSQEEILCVTLSILGNCCSRVVSNQDLREEVLELDIASRVVLILRKVTNEGVRNRACRLIGNLAQAHNLSRELHRANATTAIIPVLGNTTCPLVKQMAVRALRWLWEADKYHSDMLRAGAVKAIAAHLDTDDKQLRPVVLRALVAFTQPCSSASAIQIALSGTGYNHIVSMLDQHVISVLICNLSQSSEGRIELSKAGAVPCIMEKLQNGKINSYLITAICRMCRESMVRASIRTIENGFKTFLSILSNKKARMYHMEVLNAITQFNYDQQSVMMMVRAGLIEILTEKLNEYVVNHGFHHEETSEIVEILSVSPSRSWSPSYESSIPSNLTYSPQCSSPELDDEDMKTTTSCDSSSTTNVVEKLPEGPTGEDGCILEVISHLTYQQVPMARLASRTTISSFLDYLVTLRYPQNRQNYLKASKTLCSIVSCKHYYNSLLEEECILAIHKDLCRAKHKECSHCERLHQTGKAVIREATLAAQSGLGEGEMSYRLATASDQVKISVALTIPHVVWKPNLLHSLLFTQDAFQVLIECLDTRIEEAVPALNQLFNTICIKNPQVSMETCSHCDIASIRKEGNVSFTLDDGSTVTANKESLSHNCPMFEAMFRGGFKESQQTTIRLTEISSDCLTHFTRLADEYCQCVLPKELSTLLEMIMATDRFLLPDLTERIVKYVMNSALTHLTCHEVYDWGLKVGYKLPVSAQLSTDSIKFLFTSDNMTCVNRVQAVTAILSSPNKAQFISDLTSIVKEGLQSYSKSFRFIQRTR